MTTPLQPHDHAGTLQRTEWCLGLSEPTITTLTDAGFVRQVGLDLRPLSAYGPGAELLPSPQDAHGTGSPPRRWGGRRRPLA